jgi:hypothetical protein
MDTKIKKNNSDLLIDLPTDKNQPTHLELKVFDSLFKENYEDNTKTSSLKIIFQYILLTFLIMLFYLIPNETIKKFVPTALNNIELTPIVIKGVCISIIFYFFQVYYMKVKF